MRSSILQFFVIISCYITIVIALPFASQKQDTPKQRLKRVPYSVVPVDGGSTVTATIAQTVTRTVTESSDSTQTVTITPSVIGTTALATATSTSQLSSAAFSPSSFSVVDPSQPTDTVLVPIIPILTPLSQASASSSYSSTSSMSIPLVPFTTASLPASTTAAAPGFLNSTIMSSSATQTSTTKTYDDGMWHTTYPPWNATSITPAATGTAFATYR